MGFLFIIQLENCYCHCQSHIENSNFIYFNLEMTRKSRIPINFYYFLIIAKLKRLDKNMGNFGYYYPSILETQLHSYYLKMSEAHQHSREHQHFYIFHK